MSLPSSSLPLPSSASLSPSVSPPSAFVHSPAAIKAFVDNPLIIGHFPDVGRHPDSLSTPFTESCLFKSALSGVMGGGLGFAFGLFTASMGSGVNSYALAPGMPGWVDTTNMPLKEQIRRTGKEMWGSMKSSAKSFGTFGLVYTAIECGIEKQRGTHDVYNPLMAGCATGGLFGARGGPQAAAFGCAGFAAFGYVIDKFTQLM
jgi:import inner membrane translocase subunit TIM22